MFRVPGYNEVSAESQAVFDELKKSSGKVSNLYATIGYSGIALSAYVNFVHSQAKGTFHGKEREAIFLIVSQLNGCEYCLAAHTASAMKFGWKEEETLMLRSGNFPEEKWKVIYRVIQAVIENKGEVGEDRLQDFFEQGFNEGALMDLMVLVSIMSFTNYVYRLTKIPIDYPAAKVL